MKTFANIGSQVKVGMFLQCDDLTGKDFDFKAKFFTFLGGVAVEMSKDSMTACEDGEFRAVIDTKWFSPGELMVTVKADIPDTDTSAGTRREIGTFPTGIILKKGALL